MPSISDELEVVFTRVFAAAPNGGNPCPVVLNADGLTDAAMQQLAREFNLDTAFILRPTKPGAHMRIRFFVPQREMGISGHATIAAITAAIEHGLVTVQSLRIETLNGLFPVRWNRENATVFVSVEQRPPTFGETRQWQDVAPALRLKEDDFDA